MPAHEPPNKLIVAHRGDRTHARENTLEAFRAAIECGADMIEFDIRRTLDGSLVIHHDPAINERSIAQTAYADLLRYAPYHLPLLTEVLDLAAGRIQLDVELKEPGYEKEVLRQIFDGRFSAVEFVITSFFPESLGAVADQVRTGLLIEEMSWPAALELCRSLHPDFLAPEYTMVQSSPGIPLLPWTVNDPVAIERLLEVPDVFGVITDKPRDALRVRAPRTHGSLF